MLGLERAESGDLNALATLQRTSLPYREAAETLNIPVGTVKSRLHAAVGRLGLMWEDSHDADPGF